MRMRKKKWVLPFLEEEKVYLCNDFNQIPTDRPLYLEIGMGMGDFICESAREHPEIFYIGLEKDETCVARAIKKAQEYELSNLRIFLIDAKDLTETFPASSIDRIYLHFSDPWPKKAHHKRRLTFPTFLALYEELLKEGGTIIFKTDNHDLFFDSLEYFRSSPFVILEINEDYHAVKRSEPMTAYENKFVGLGQPIYYCKLRK